LGLREAKKIVHIPYPRSLRGKVTDFVFYAGYVLTEFVKLGFKVYIFGTSANDGLIQLAMFL